MVLLIIVRICDELCSTRDRCGKFFIVVQVSHNIKDKTTIVIVQYDKQVKIVGYIALNLLKICVSIKRVQKHQNCIKYQPVLILHVILQSL